MNERRKVRGVLDAVEALSEGEEFELVGTDFGLGLTVTPEAKRLVYLGALSENLHNLEAALEKLNAPEKRCRAKGAFRNKARAHSLWLLAHYLAAISRPFHMIVFSRPVNWSTRELLLQVHELDWDTELFPVTTQNLEESVSRGRKELGIGDGWQSKVCEKIFSDLSQTK